MSKEKAITAEEHYDKFYNPIYKDTKHKQFSYKELIQFAIEYANQQPEFPKSVEQRTLTEELVDDMMEAMSWYENGNKRFPEYDTVLATFEAINKHIQCAKDVRVGELREAVENAVKRIGYMLDYWRHNDNEERWSHFERVKTELEQTLKQD